MREFLIGLLMLLAFVGITFILGVCTRGTDKGEKDRDHVFLTFMRGLGTVGVIFAALSVLATIGLIIYEIFD